MAAKSSMVCWTLMILILSSVSVVASSLNAQEAVDKAAKQGHVAKGVQRTIQRESQKNKVPKTSAISWRKLSDQQIARLLLPDEKQIYFGESSEGLVKEGGTIDGAVVHKVKRLVANFDNDPANEMAVLIRYSTGMCTFCVNNVIVAILDPQDGKINVRWRTEEIEAFDNDGSADIATLKLIKKDKFFELAYIYNGTPGGVSSSKEMGIIRWDGERFSKIWQYKIESHDTGGHEAIPHDSLARVDFIDDQKEAQRIKVVAMYATPPHAEDPTRYVLYEEFTWSEQDQRYWSVRQRERRYEKDQECVFIKEPGRRDYRRCHKIESRR